MQVLLFTYARRTDKQVLDAAFIGEFDSENCSQEINYACQIVRNAFRACDISKVSEFYVRVDGGEQQSLMSFFVDIGVVKI